MSHSRLCIPFLKTNWILLAVSGLQSQSCFLLLVIHTVNSYVSSHIDLPLFVRWFYPSLGYVLLLWYVCKYLSKSNNYVSAETWLSCHDNLACQLSQCDAIGRNNRCLMLHSVEFPIHVRLINNTLWSPRQKMLSTWLQWQTSTVLFFYTNSNRTIPPLHRVSLGGCWGHRGLWKQTSFQKNTFLTIPLTCLVHSQQQQPDIGDWWLPHCKPWERSDCSQWMKQITSCPDWSIGTQGSQSAVYFLKWI